MRLQLANAVEVLNKVTKNNLMKIVLTKEDRCLLSDVFEHFKSEDGLQMLSSWLRLQDKHLPLELLWRLHKDDVLQFTTYIYYNTHHIKSVNSGFTYALWPENVDDADICCEMVCDLLSVLINIGAHSQRDIAKPCQELLHLVIEQIFLVLNAGDTIQEIYSIIISKKYNWKWLLLTISLFVMSNSESAQLVKDAVDSWIVKACKTQDVELLAVALLSARQCGAVSTSFGSYAAWFGSLQIKSTQGFSFFIQFLSQLVPNEPALYLKIHVNKVPTAPSSCHGLLADYVSLAKTRLNDLNETTDYVGLFNDFYTNEQEGRQSDISRVLAHFSETGEIIKTVLEASVFRRQYYEKVFLPELLKVSESKDTNKACLIKKLHSMGKIPSAMFNKWSKSVL